MYNFDPYNVLLAIATNILVLLKTGFVLQGHKWWWNFGPWTKISVRMDFPTVSTTTFLFLLVKWSDEQHEGSWVKWRRALETFFQIVLTQLLKNANVIIWDAEIQRDKMQQPRTAACALTIQCVDFCLCIQWYANLPQVNSENTINHVKFDLKCNWQTSLI